MDKRLTALRSTNPTIRARYSLQARLGRLPGKAEDYKVAGGDYDGKIKPKLCEIDALKLMLF